MTSRCSFEYSLFVLRSESNKGKVSNSSLNNPIYGESRLCHEVELSSDIVVKNRNSTDVR